MIIDDTIERSSGWLDVHKLMDQAARENAANVAEHGAYQPTLVDEAEQSYQTFKIGVWELGHDDPEEARRWLRTAVDRGIAEAEPLLQLCQRVLEPTAAGRDVLGDEHESALAERQTGARADAEASDVEAPESTPIYNAVEDMVVVSDDDAATTMTIYDNDAMMKMNLEAVTPEPAEPASWLQMLALAPLPRWCRLRWHDVTDYDRAELAERPYLAATGEDVFDIVFVGGVHPGAHIKSIARVTSKIFTFSQRPGRTASEGSWLLSLTTRSTADFEHTAVDLVGLFARCTGERTSSGLLLPPRTEGASGAPVTSSRGGPAAALTDLELTIATFAACGHAVRDIARTLGIAAAAVQHHLGEACKKLHITSAAELLIALRSGERCSEGTSPELDVTNRT